MRNLKYYLSFYFAFVLLCLPFHNGISWEDISQKEIEVTVDGAVKNSGTYHLASYATIDDLLKLIELQPEADLSSVNPAMVLKNNDRIIIPYHSETVKVSINHSSIEQLITLPGIGEKTAQRIIDYRNENGLFQKLSDITLVKGIGEKTYEKLKDLICL